MKLMSNEWFVEKFLPFMAVVVNAYLVFFICAWVYSEFIRT